jgi:hypothetical protein
MVVTSRCLEVMCKFILPINLRPISSGSANGLVTLLKTFSRSIPAPPPSGSASGPANAKLLYLSSREQGAPRKQPRPGHVSQCAGQIPLLGCVSLSG